MEFDMTEEDEAFDEIARKQGMWGGGFMAKKAMAADKLQDGKCKYCVDGCIACDARAQPAQEPVAREWNFCPRCGKRTKDLTVIHTCTPPQEKNL
jgi:ribosomal protein S27AE